MDVLARPEFLLPVNRLKPGMELSRNVVLRGATLLRFGTVLNDDLIQRLRGIGVDSVHVFLSDDDFDSYKQVLLAHDTPPAYESTLRAMRGIFLQSIPPQARPANCCSEDQRAERVEEVMDHTLDLLFSSRQLFQLMKEAGFFLTPLLTHSLGAWVYSLCVGVELDYNLPAMLDLSISSLFYDVGMTKVPSSILFKPGSLSELEYAEVKKHTYYGRNILDDYANISPRAPVVAFEHHENFYGGGYPRNKRGDAIHEFSQIVAITDKFAALITDKAHRERKDPSDAVEILMAYTKTAVSPKVFVAFLRSVRVYPRNALLRLSTGEIATPLEYPSHKPYRPVVRVVFDREGNEILHLRRQIDLSLNPGIKVVSFTVPEEAPIPPPR